MTEEFRAAGEFYGHLLTTIGGGDLAMRYERQRFFDYRWTKETNNRRLSAAIRLTGTELTQARSLGDLARLWAAKWERQIKETTG